MIVAKWRHEIVMTLLLRLINMLNCFEESWLR